MVVLDERLEALETLTLLKGAHKDFDAGVCIMEAVSWIAGEPFSDHPQCVSPVISAFMRRWNDDLDDEGRQALKPLIPLLVGTANKALEEQRGWMCADWLVRVHTPTWLELAGIKESAQALRDLPPLVDLASLDLARPVLKTSQNKAAAAWDAARAAAGAAAWDAAWDAARAAAGAAAWDAAWDAAGAAAGDAARAAAWDAARAAARDAAGAAAGAAARDALAPTVLGLKDSAVDLVERMCALGGEA